MKPIKYYDIINVKDLMLGGNIMYSMMPKKRSKSRLFLGKAYFTFRRYISWYMKNNNFASLKSSKMLPYVVFTHKTPLIRKLKDVEMWLQYNLLEEGLFFMRLF